MASGVMPFIFLGFFGVHQLRLGRSCKDRGDVSWRVIVRVHHQLGRLDLAHGFHLAQDFEHGGRARFVLQDADGLFTDPVEQLGLAHNAARIEVQRQSDLFLGDTALDGLADHLVLLDWRKAADPLVVGEGLVVRGDQTFDLFDAEILQHLDPDMPIQQHIGAFLPRGSRDDRRLDQANLFD